MRWTFLGMLVLTLVSTTDVSAQREFQFFASVLDSSGAPVTTVTQKDIHITENGVEGKVAKLESIDWPVTVALLVDNGAGLSTALGDLRNGALKLVESLPEDVEISLQTTAPQPRYLVRPTKDRQMLKQGLDRLTTDDSPARFVETLVETATRFDKDKGNAFPVVVVLGSANSDASQTREKELERMMQQLRQRATVHIVMLAATATSPGGGGRGRGTARGPVAGINHVAVAENLAKTTGGRYESVAAPNRVVTLLPEIGTQITKSQLRQSKQYRITYERPNPAIPIGDIRMFAGEGTNTTLTMNGRLP